MNALECKSFRACSTCWHHRAGECELVAMLAGAVESPGLLTSAMAERPLFEMAQA